MAIEVQITGGSFQDPRGAPLASGYLLFKLSQDAQVNGSEEVSSGETLKVPLDANGNIVTSPIQSLWPNDVLLPANTFYMVSAYTAQGQLVWGPNAQTVLSTPSPYNVGAWVPGIVNILPSVGILVLQTNGVNNGSQAKLNLVAGSNIILTDDGSGDVTISANSGADASPIIVNPSTGIFDGSLGSGFKLTLSQNTNATFENMFSKLLVVVRIVQPPSGATFSLNWPTNVRNGGQVSPGNGSRSVQTFSVDTDGSLDAAGPMQYS